MKSNVIQSISILISGVMISASIIFAVDNAASLNKDISRAQHTINNTLKQQIEATNALKKLSAAEFDKESFEHLLSECISVSKVGYSVYDQDRKRHCMNQIIDTNIR